MTINTQRGTPITATATHGSSAVATVTGATNTIYYVTDISGSSDLSSSTILVKNGSTTIWQDIVGAGSYRMNFNTPLTCTSGSDVSVTVTGTSACKANLSGVSITTA